MRNARTGAPGAVGGPRGSEGAGGQGAGGQGGGGQGGGGLVEDDWIYVVFFAVVLSFSKAFLLTYVSKTLLIDSQYLNRF